MSELKHVGIIVDGNGRWAISRNKKRSEGHLEGSKNLEKLILKNNKTNDEINGIEYDNNFRIDYQEFLDNLYNGCINYILDNIDKGDNHG